MTASRSNDWVVTVAERVRMSQKRTVFGFNDVAHLDDGTMWPTSFALTEWTADNEARIGSLVKQAVR